MPDSTGRPRAAEGKPRRGPRCRICREYNLRRSKFRFSDVGYVLLWQYPVRCLSCSKRQHIFVWQTKDLVYTRSSHPGEARPGQRWETFRGRKPQAVTPDNSSDKDVL